jgi:hypothetical protein
VLRRYTQRQLVARTEEDDGEMCELLFKYQADSDYLQAQNSKGAPKSINLCGPARSNMLTVVLGLSARNKPATFSWILVL